MKRKVLESSDHDWVFEYVSWPQSMERKWRCQRCAIAKSGGKRNKPSPDAKIMTWLGDRGWERLSCSEVIVAKVLGD